MSFREAAAARAAGVRAATDRPAQRRCAEDGDSPSAARMPTTVRAQGSEGEPHVAGMASVTERGYEMWDMFGPYTEVVSLGAFDKTLAANPLVEFTLNHNRSGGAPMAHTRNDTLTLSVVKEGTETGLAFDALVDPTRNDVSDMLKALNRRDLGEASFKFFIVRGQWSPDYTEFRINRVDIHRGDVAIVGFGANPYTVADLVEAAWKAPDETARAVLDSLNLRFMRHQDEPLMQRI